MRISDWSSDVCSSDLTAKCLADYYRMPMQSGGSGIGIGALPAIAQLVEEGELLPVQIEGWNRPAYLHRDARIPRKVDRSEEHTSELQSLMRISYAVFCLKKKNEKQIQQVQ